MSSPQTMSTSSASSPVETRSVSAEYSHHQRLVSTGPELVLPKNRLKWYQISRTDVQIPESLVEESRSFIYTEVESGRLDIATEQGFAMLHLGDEPSSRNTFVMLFVCTWRHGNELWRSLYTKSLHDGGEFQRFVEDGHMGAFCVWELGPVWHERQAWSRFLYSARDGKALKDYLSDQFTGPV
jgi:hypothetical protein